MVRVMGDVPVTVAGWATTPSGDDWHAFTVENPDKPVTSRCGEAELPAACLLDLERVPRGRPCLDCLLIVTADTPDPGRMGTAL